MPQLDTNSKGANSAEGEVVREGYGYRKLWGSDGGADPRANSLDRKDFKGTAKEFSIGETSDLTERNERPLMQEGEEGMEQGTGGGNDYSYNKVS